MGYGSIETPIDGRFLFSPTTRASEAETERQEESTSEYRRWNIAEVTDHA